MPVDDLRSGTWVTYIGGRATSARLRRCRVEILTGADAGLVRDIEASVIRIGARRGNDVQLTDSKVSGLHCEIRLDERGYRLRDLDSTNGTYVGGMRVNDVYVQPGAQIALGGTRFRFEPLGETVEIELSEHDRFGSMIGRSVKMRELFARLEKLAKSDTTVLVTGETGVGKELVAEAVHDNSPRAQGPFIVLDCGSIPPNLIESELFGHERGAFTRRGRIRTPVRSSARTAARCSSTRSASCRWRCSRSYCACSSAKKVRRVGGTKTIEARRCARGRGDQSRSRRRGESRTVSRGPVLPARGRRRIHVPPLRERRMISRC